MELLNQIKGCGITFIPMFQVSSAVSCKNLYSAGLTSSGTYYLSVSGHSLQVSKDFFVSFAGSQPHDLQITASK